MYLIYHRLPGGMLLAAGTRLPLLLNGQKGTQMDALLLFQAAYKAVALSVKDQEYARLHDTGSSLNAESVDESVLGPLRLLRAQEIEQDGTRYGLLSRVWHGPHLIPHLALSAPGEHIAKRRRLTGWSNAQRNTEISIAAVAAPQSAGYLIWGGDAGLRAGGREGWTRPPIFLEDSTGLPQEVLRFIYAEPPG